MGSSFVTQSLSLILLISELILLTFIDVMDVLGLNFVVIFLGVGQMNFWPTQYDDVYFFAVLLFLQDVHSLLWFI